MYLTYMEDMVELTPEMWRTLLDRVQEKKRKEMSITEGLTSDTVAGLSKPATKKTKDNRI